MVRTMGWHRNFLARSPMFEPLRVHAVTFGSDWPRLADLQRLLDQREPPVRNAAGIPLRLVPQARRRARFEDGYEPGVYLKGELQVREGNWHDLFNVLVWLAFPRAKAALNARHYAELQARRAPEGGAGAPLGMRPRRRASPAGNEAQVSDRGNASTEVNASPGEPLAGAARQPNRGPAQDALTLFDEGGVIVSSSDGTLLDCLREWRWKDLFWGARARVPAHMRFFLFGHAVCEKALEPFLGITSRGILLEVEGDLLAAPLPEQLATVDARIAEHLADGRRLVATRELAVVPILGVPGWYPGNDQEAFYDNVDYFRARRSGEMGG